MNNEKVKFFKDKPDISMCITNDNIINITGMIGSGKSTMANKYRNNEEYIVISLDCLYKDQDKENSNIHVENINQFIKEKFPEKNNFEYFNEYYNIILEYIKQQEKIGVIEGQQIYRYIDINNIKGKIIVKRSSIFHCWYRSIRRHITKKYKLYKNGEISLKKYIKNSWYWIKRRTFQIRHYKKMNTFLYKLVENSVINTAI